MCSCETDYNVSCVRRDRAWHLYHSWYNHSTTPIQITNAPINVKLFFKDYPDVLKKMRDGKQIKIILYSKLRKETQKRRRSLKTWTQHCRFNAFGSVFYTQTKVSPTFMLRKIVEYLG